MKLPRELIDQVFMLVFDYKIRTEKNRDVVYGFIKDLADRRLRNLFLSVLCKKASKNNVWTFCYVLRDFLVLIDNLRTIHFYGKYVGLYNHPAGLVFVITAGRDIARIVSVFNDHDVYKVEVLKRLFKCKTVTCTSILDHPCIGIDHDYMDLTWMQRIVHEKLEWK